MSGGKDQQHKARNNKATAGWEEAGGEFYQESFPTDLDGAMQRDPSAIATLLPSKQNRAGNFDLLYFVCFDFLIIYNDAHVIICCAWSVDVINLISCHSGGCVCV